MSDPNSSHTTVRETRVEKKGGGSALAFILGGVVVAIAVVAFFVYNGAPSGGGDGGGDTNVTIETPAAPAADTGADTAPAEQAPAAN